MSKIEYNPRKRRHIDFLYAIIMELHTEIFQQSMIIVKYDDNCLGDLKKQLQTKIDLYKKYSRRLKILEL